MRRSCPECRKIAEILSQFQRDYSREPGELAGTAVGRLFPPMIKWLQRMRDREARYRAYVESKAARLPPEVSE